MNETTTNTYQADNKTDSKTYNAENCGKKVLISVVIPSYNRADTVGQTIDSIIEQEVDADIEIIIGDDCSTDNAREVLADYQKRFPKIIKLLLYEHNIGLGANWATCIKACKGKYICNCDNDDYWHNKKKLQLQLDYMESHPDCNVLLTNHRTHNRSTGEIKECEAFIDRTLPLQDAFWQGKTHVCNATIMYRRDFLLAHVNLDDFISHHFFLQDWNAWVILSAYTDFEILPVSTATFGIETASITRPKDYDKYRKRLNEDKKVCKYLDDLFYGKFHFDEAEWDDYTSYRLMRLALKKNDYKNAHLFARQTQHQDKYTRTANSRLLYCLFRLMKLIKP